MPGAEVEEVKRTCQEGPQVPYRIWALSGDIGNHPTILRL